MYKVNKEKCIGCQVCVQTCPEATKIADDGKAEVVNSKKLEECGGESVCPIGAIEKTEK
ncbi:MAG: ferredoxin [Candidatus Nealsonbacteria bacterium CG23_combo_of_CG06-09_8_20_14_all_39_25]|uniref:Ferredoxin n=4 Tax=Candidatus Nealsoniibacteriota TaxID=1817911 RepID=A0A2G9YUC9_9BACT|nr:MAG: ferredoxin [Candidatus Nealsonbacteria bacterium CG23_combo_of_CG06-09_8_20_14_all_39_25]PIQ98645.1 MAG: ferredoxin [Candidatus Nealsonbacteria bacterium CG11_big_fil_rev_8_21_14_0_20_39_9]PIW90624.1 MAG: ferredoxin [Candidatus Nealsonbacteria bacterium CG_4_8_14_3_um_filter_40_11]PIZ88017.1 MAG: ferredoxin [Candidatus Nealsonbacteria bacterium CG_4_10_14_0_2_um_filter_39_15]